MGISAASTFITLSARKSEMMEEAFQAVQPEHRSFCEGRLAGLDGVSAIHNPYASGPLRIRWFDGHTIGKKIAIGKDESNCPGFLGVQ